VLDENADLAWFADTYSPWFRRGGDYNNGLDAGVFAFANEYGRVAGNVSFRVVYVTIFK